MPDPAVPPSAPSSVELDGLLLDDLVQLTFAISAQLNRIGARHDLSLTQIRLLGVLRDRTPQLGQLAVLLGLERSTVSGLVDRAARRGLVERRAGRSGDGRAVEVRMTAAGRRLASAFVRELAEAVDALLGPLSPADRARLHRILGPVVAP